MAAPNKAHFDVIRWPLRLTWAGFIAERVTQAFWPFWSVAMVALALILFGAFEIVTLELFWAFSVLGLLALGLSFAYGIWCFRFPSRAEAVTRLDATLAGRPLQAVQDDQAFGADDPTSQALWRAHQARMAERLGAARRVAPDLRLSRQDPFALRYVAVLGLAVGLLFGSLSRVSDFDAPSDGRSVVAAPAWEGWIEPPLYTGLPVLYLADLTAETLEIPKGSQLILRFYGDVGALTLAETVSGRVGDIPAASAAEHSFAVAQAGRLDINGPGGRGWDIALRPDQAPTVALSAGVEATFDGQMSLPFEATDDFGVVSGQVAITLDQDRLVRRFGLLLDPEDIAPVLRDLPMPLTGGTKDITEVFIDNFSEHPWAHLPVIFTFEVTDAAGQTGRSDPLAIALPARNFFDPLARAVVEQRRDLLWNRANGRRIVQVMRAISWQPEEQLFRDESTYLLFRTILRQLETAVAGGIADDQQTQIAAALWDLAIQLEEGDVDDARERMARAQERLSEAMRNGASDAEIAELMQELRDATQNYMRQLAQQNQREQDQMDDFESAENQNNMQMDMNDLQRLMERIQELMEEGRMAEAQQALEELQELMENMRVTEGPGQQSPGEQAMEGLRNTLRDQQGLSDQAFRDLQEQFNPNAQQGQSSTNEGRNGGQGRGQSHEGQGGESGQGEGGSQSGGSQSGDGDDAGSLSDRQQALREELNRQRRGLPGLEGDAGQAAREALEQAERAMRGAQEALEGGDLAGAIEDQAEAMNNLRDGLRNMGQALAEAQTGQQGQGQQTGQAGGIPQRDPLGRAPGDGAPAGTDQNLLQGEDVYRRARELLDEIRRRSGEEYRPEIELDYLKRLLDRF